MLVMYLKTDNVCCSWMCIYQKALDDFCYDFHSLCNYLWDAITHLGPVSALRKSRAAEKAIPA
jgi:hypothetical protein